MGAGYFFMIIRKYNDGDTDMEVSVTPGKMIQIQLNEALEFLSIELTHKDAKDLQDILYAFLREIEPKEPEKNG